MQLQHTLILSSLATAINAASTCVEGATLSENWERSWFSRQSNGIHVASFRNGYANFAAPSLNSKQGVLQLSNSGTQRLSVCLIKNPSGITCYWLNAGDTCKTNAYVDPNWSLGVRPPALISYKTTVNVNQVGSV